MPVMNVKIVLKDVKIVMALINVVSAMDNFMNIKVYAMMIVHLVFIYLFIYIQHT